jgi:hypothetical protein
MNTNNYAMTASTLSNLELDNVMKPILEIGLRSGICRKITRTKVFAPRKYMGLGIKQPCVTQSIRKLETLLNQSHTTTLQLIDARWVRMAIECGIGPQFLKAKNANIMQLATRGLLKSLWDFLSIHDIWLTQLDTNHKRQLRNENDTYIMNNVCRHGKWGIKDLLLFNACQLFLQVELFSDVDTADGKFIRNHIWQGNLTTEHTKYITTHFQPAWAGETAWLNWRIIMKETYGCNDGGKLNRGVGCINSTNDWQWYLNQQTDRLYRKTYQGWEMQSWILQGRRTQQ